MRNATLGLRFLLELAMLAALAYWGSTVPDGVLLRIVLGIGAPLLAAVIWGTFLAPRAGVALPPAALVVLELAVFGAAALALAAAGQPQLAGVVAVAAVAQRVVLSLLGVHAGVTPGR